MNNEHPIQLGKWQKLLIFAAGSVTTIILPTLAARGRAIDDGFTVAVNEYGHSISDATLLWPLGIVLVYWTLLCASVGVWIMVGQGWRELAHDTRLRLGLGYLAVAWSGAFAWSMNTPAINAAVGLLGIALAIVFTASWIEGRRHESDVFP